MADALGSNSLDNADSLGNVESYDNVRSARDSQHSSSRFADARRKRCEAFGIEMAGMPECVKKALSHDSLLVSVVCSRVGHDAKRHRTLSQQIAASLQQIKHDDAVLLIAGETAIEPWVAHAADVFHVPTLRIESIEERDRLVIALADRVDAVYVRPGGKVTKLLKNRAAIQSGIVRIAIDVGNSQRKLEWDLLGAGAVGRYLPDPQPDPTAIDSSVGSSGHESAFASINSVDWSSHLVHCTRSVSGPWPGQTWDQYRDDLLLADPQSASRDAIDALCRIIRKQRLVAGAITSRRDAPVVCLSEVPLPDLLARRTYRSHLHRWDYEPFGIAIRRDAATHLGVQPVIYGDHQTEKDLPPEDRYRFQSIGRTHDWTAEREWRSASDIDLSQLDADEVSVFVPDASAAARVASVNRPGWQIFVTGQDQ
ncbi:hypothetical protein [Rhodopirellula sp. SWK7]|uniref:hypothetical protein n=1 Tax=Rhodopirellula sp. SWK7 TaxID=595460 RepID=UPI0002BEA0AD|nr:hypothetical protein [Rhodopirellula sp. SWK7]EMI41861.1 hypothetical protein RRSWK_05676 [Rhodopirellula sp. SWK7]